MPPWATAQYALKGVWLILVALAFAILLTLLAVQTVRLEGFKVWPLSVEGWKPKAQRLQNDLDNVRKAQDSALAKELAAKLKAEQEYRDLAERIDTDAEKVRAGALDDAERFIAANRVRCQAAGGSRGGPVATAEDNSASGGQGTSAAPELDEVAVPAEDIRICTRNTLQAEAAREWALGLEGAP